MYNVVTEFSRLNLGITIFLITQLVKICNLVEINYMENDLKM